MSPEAIPTGSDPKGAQDAADAENYRTVASRVFKATSVATANENNLGSIKKLYNDPYPSRGGVPLPSTQFQHRQLPGDICKSVQQANRNTGNGVGHPLGESV